MFTVLNRIVERNVDIPVSRELRDEIKVLKREKTYEQFLSNLIKNGNPAPGGRKT